MIKLYLKLVLKFVLLIACLLSLILQIRLLNRGRAEIKDVVNRYVPVSAVIFESDIKVIKKRRVRRRLTPNTKYLPIIRYNYIVDDQVHISTRYTAYDFYSYDRRDIQRIVWQNQKGFRVTAYYDPQKPGDSVLVLPVLENFSDDQVVYIVLMSSLVLIVGSWVLWSLRGLKHAYSCDVSTGQNTE